jgi:tRNA threonylcarbamoyladenosine biosynthesis protein TsaB
MQVNQKSATSQPSTSSGARSTGLLLSVDTCGPSGSVALGQLNSTSLNILGLTELEGRSYSATLVAAVADLLAKSGALLRDLQAIVAVNGPGSFTGVRVGLSAIKGLAEPVSIPVVAVSRLVVLAMKTGLASAALDAHRHEVFLRIGSNGAEGMELLAGRTEFAAIDPPPSQIAVCDEAAADLLAKAWPLSELMHVDAPNAADAMRQNIARVLESDFIDLASLDGHYLRRSDAEIFGEPAGVRRS